MLWKIFSEISHLEQNVDNTLVVYGLHTLYNNGITWGRTQVFKLKGARV